VTDDVNDIAVTINEIDDPVDCAAVLAKNWPNTSRDLLLDLIAESEPVLVRMGFKPLRALRAELAKTRRQA
jgi:hypothetical protein